MKFGSMIDQLETIGVQHFGCFAAVAWWPPLDNHCVRRWMVEDDDEEDQTDFVVYLLFVDEQGMHRHSSIASIHWYMMMIMKMMMNH